MKLYLVTIVILLIIFLIFSNIFIQNKKEGFNNVGNSKQIFILWFQGFENAPLIVKKCLFSWKLKNPNWKIIELDNNNLSKYINFDKEIINFKNKKIEYPALSDIIRLTLLNKYGGVWVDATTFCNKPLDDWINKYNKFGFWCFNKPGPDRLISSWFIFSKKNNYIIIKWYLEMINYWNTNDKIDNYFWVHYLFNKLYNNDEKFKKIWNNVNKLSAGKSEGPHYFIPYNISYNNPMTNESKEHIDKIKTPLYKLNYKMNITNGSAISYLLNKIYIENDGKFSIYKKILVENIDSLLTIDRMDIIINRIYCKFYDNKIKSNFAINLYLNDKKHEKGNKLIEHEPNMVYRMVSQKETEQEWINKLNNLIDDIKNNNFFWKNNIRVIDNVTINKNNNKLIRGAHRVAVCHYFKKKIYAIYNNEKHLIHNCKYLNDFDYEYVFNEFINLKDNTLAFILFPKYNNFKNDNFITNTIKNDKYMNLLYKKQIYLNENGFIYFLIIIYQIHNIFGIGSLNYDVIKNKLNGSYVNNKLIIYFIEKKNYDSKYIVNFKKNIVREYIDNKNNNFTFHISDNHKETKNIAQFALNNNNIFFANNNNIHKFNKSYPSLTDIKHTNINKIIDVHQIIKDVNINSEDYCIVGSTILNLFGIRKNKDIDIISHNLVNKKYDNHNKYFLKILNMEPDEIIFNPNNHMYFFNIKCITLEIYLKFKIKRYEINKDNKDKIDIYKIENLLNK